MTGGRGKCRAITAEPDDGRPGGCRGLVDAIVLVRTEGAHPENPRFIKVGLCKQHCQRWLNHLADPEQHPPVRYKPHQPPVIEDLP